MKTETRQLIEQAFSQLHEASQDESNQMTDVGMLMYGLCMAIIDLDEEVKTLQNKDNGFSFI